jgi:ferritin-like metal-binding protein YciE
LKNSATYTSAENQLLKALPKMAKDASSEELKLAFENHLDQTKVHVERLEEIFERLDETPKGKTCQAMKGLVEEGSEILEEDGEESVLDAGIIAAAQKVEHYEIASYGTVRTFAQLLGEDEAAELLQETLDEEARPTNCSPNWRRRSSIRRRFWKTRKQRPPVRAVADQHRTFLVLSDLRGRFGRADR